MKRFSYLLAIALVAAVALAVVATPTVAKAPAKVTGSVGFNENGVRHTFTLNLTEGLTWDFSSTSTLTYVGSDGNWDTVQIVIDRFQDSTVWFGGPIVDTSSPTHVGLWLRGTVTDGNRLAPDTFWATVTTSPVVVFNWVVNQGVIYPGTGPYLSQYGNLTVH